MVTSPFCNNAYEYFSRHEYSQAPGEITSK